LEKDGAEFVGGAENAKPPRTARSSAGVAPGIESWVNRLPEFGGEKEAWIARTRSSIARRDRTQGLVERRVDFDGVEKFGKIGGFVEALGMAHG